MGRNYMQRSLSEHNPLGFADNPQWEHFMEKVSDVAKAKEVKYMPAQVPKKRYTQFTRARFEEIKKLWLDGSLLEKFTKIEAGEIANTKAAEVESRQIRAIAALYSKDNFAVLRRVNLVPWKELHVYRDEQGVFSVQAIG